MNSITKNTDKTYTKGVKNFHSVGSGISHLTFIEQIRMKVNYNKRNGISADKKVSAFNRSENIVLQITFNFFNRININNGNI